jgi:hypothetical protein
VVKLKTKICIFSGSFYGGGAEKVSINLANYFKKKKLFSNFAFNQWQGSL